jgi:hypothetical protein
LADVEGSTRLWETQLEEMTAAFARLDQALCDLVSAHGGVRPVEQGEGDSFVAAFARASDAVSCALALQRAPLAPLRLRIGVHTGEVRLRDEGNYIGPTINRTARLRELAYGGQTVLSGTASDLVADMLPGDAWLTDLGTHTLRDLPRPERVVQLCHPDLASDFPPLRVRESVAADHLPVQLTRFVGRGAEIAELQEILFENRLVTLTGAGGAGKTRLAIQVASRLVTEFGDGVWYVDLAPLTDPGLVPVALARGLGLPGSSAATRSTTRSASSTSSIAKTLPTQLTTTGRSPAGTEQGWKESDPRAHSHNAQPHHRLPGSNSKTGSLRQEPPTSRATAPDFPACAGVPKGPRNSKECGGNRSRAGDTRWCDRLSPDHRRQISAKVFPVSDSQGRLICVPPSSNSDVLALGDNDERFRGRRWSNMSAITGAELTRT